jgi:negative regulator of sigma E activity
MNQQRQEMLSALFDGECSEFEVRRVLGEMTDAEVQQLRRYQLMRDACSKQVTATHCKMDISSAVASAIANEPSVKPSRKTAKPMIGFATAAAFAFVAVFGVQQWRLAETATGNGFVAEGNVSASQLPLMQSPGLSTASGSAVVIADKEQARKNKEKQEAEKNKLKAEQRSNY